jgi:hypothetical protein
MVATQFNAWNYYIWVEGVSRATGPAFLPNPNPHNSVPTGAIDLNPSIGWAIPNMDRFPTPAGGWDSSIISDAPNTGFVTPVDFGMDGNAPPNTFFATFAPTGPRSGSVALDYRGFDWDGTANRIPSRFMDEAHPLGPRPVAPNGDAIMTHNATVLTLRFGIWAEAPDAFLEIRIGNELVFRAPITTPGIRPPDLREVEVSAEARRFHSHLVLPDIRFAEGVRGDLYNEPGVTGVGAGDPPATWFEYVRNPAYPSAGFPVDRPNTTLHQVAGNNVLTVDGMAWRTVRQHERDSHVFGPWQFNAVPQYPAGATGRPSLPGRPIRPVPSASDAGLNAVALELAAFRNFQARFRNYADLSSDFPLYSMGVVGGTHIPVFIESFRVWAMGDVAVLNTATAGSDAGNVTYGVDWNSGQRRVPNSWSAATGWDWTFLPGISSADEWRVIRDSHYVVIQNNRIPGIASWDDNIPLFYDVRVLERQGQPIQPGIFTVRLTAPLHYRWHTAASSALNLDGLSVRGERGTFVYPRTPQGGPQGGAPAINTLPNGSNPSGLVTLPTGETTGVRPQRNAAGREFLYLTIDVGHRREDTSAWAALEDVLIVSGLVLIPTEQARMDGDLEIDVHWGWTTDDTPQWGRYWRGYPGRADNHWNGFTGNRHETITVGTRGVGAVTLSVGDLPDPLRTGLFDDGQTHDRPYIRSATVLLEETHAGSWVTGLGSALHFTIDDRTDIQILGARYRVNNDGWGGSGYWINTWGAGQRTGNLGTNVANVLATALAPESEAPRHFNHHSQYRNRVTINPAFDPHIINNPNRHVRRMEIQFFLSVEADLAAEWKDYSNYVDIVVSGMAVDGMSRAARTLTIAELFDPIEVEVMSGVRTITPDIVHTVHGIFRNEISDIQIRETQYGVFEYGSTIQIYAVGTAISPFSTTFNTAVGVPQINAESGLRLSPARVTTDTSYGIPIIGVEFLVLEESYGVPAVITLTNNSVDSPIFPTGENLQITVVGRGIAENNHRVWAQEATGRDAHTPATGIFVSNPYARNVLAFAEFEAPYYGPSITPYPTPEPTPEPEVRGPVVISQFDNIPGVVADPIFFDFVGDRTVGFVSARAFAYLLDPLNADDHILPHYPEPGFHTIIGQHAVTGRTVQVTMRADSSDVTILIDGELFGATDIASMSLGTGVSYGGLTVINHLNNLYVPFRFIASRFGFDVQMIDAYTILFSPLI